MSIQLDEAKVGTSSAVTTELQTQQNCFGQTKKFALEMIIEQVSLIEEKLVTTP